ncbi:DUF6318 family protein [Rothia dentocariosa]|nr:DUF6318 family protein [Rothia dentocariosa]
MSSIFTRRNALFVFGTGAGAALLSACGGNSTTESSGSGSASSSDASPSTSSSSSSSSSSSASTSSSSASASSTSESSPSQSGATDIDMSGSYGGKINFESVLEYEKTGTYEPATKEHPAKNVPKPKKPAGADEKSLKGLYLSIAFAAAATQYAYNTGDYSLLEQSSMSEPERNYFLREEKERLDKTREGTFWPDNITIDYTLTQERPQLEGDGEYKWDREFIVEYGKFEVIDGKVEYHSDEDHDMIYRDIFKGNLTAQYINGAWITSAVANQPKSKS